MQTYTFFFLDGRQVVQEFEFDDCVSDAAAQLRAGELLRARPERSSVEVWDQRAQVAVLSVAS